MEPGDRSLREAIRVALRDRGVSRSLSRIRLDSTAPALVVVERRQLVLSTRLQQGPDWVVNAVADALALPAGSEQHGRAVRALRAFAPEMDSIRWLDREEQRPATGSVSSGSAPVDCRPGQQGSDQNRLEETEVARLREIELPEVEGYVWPEDAIYVLSSIRDDDAVLLCGPTGCGKSTCVQHLAESEGHRLFRINLSAGTRESDFLGCKDVTVDRATGQSITAWTDGILIQSMTHRDPVTGRGAWLLVDEVDCAPNEVLVALHRVLEPTRPRRLLVPEDGGRVVEATLDFRVVMTANTAGAGDETGIYGGTAAVNAAFRDRLSIFRLGYTAHERELLCRHVTYDTADLLVRWAGRVRSQIEEGMLSTPLSTRVLIRLADKTRKWGLEKALEVEVLNRLTAEERAAVAEICHAMLEVEV